jgi:hypothetical protein
VIQLYDRDARDIARLLDILATFVAAPKIDRPTVDHLADELARWTPTDLEPTHTALLNNADYRGDVVSARLREIIAAIEEQAGVALTGSKAASSSEPAVPMVAFVDR